MSSSLRGNCKIVQQNRFQTYVRIYSNDHARFLSKVASKKSTKSNSAYMLVYAMKNSSNAATSPESKKSSKLNQIAQMLAEKKAISVQSDALSNKQLQQQQTRTKTRVLDTAQGLKADSLAGKPD